MTVTIQPPVDGNRVINDEGVLKLARSSPAVAAARAAFWLCLSIIGALPRETARKAWTVLGCWVEEMTGEI